MIWEGILRGGGHHFFLALFLLMPYALCLMPSPLIIAIDGPAASGKSTVARLVADALNCVFVNSGAMYRAFTWWVLEKGIDPANEADVLDLLDNTSFLCGEENRRGTIAVDGLVLGATQLSSAAVNRNVSAIAAIAPVRERLVAEQRKYAEVSSVVMEGRDIGSVVFPDTPHKFYIDASPEVREQRRRAQGIMDAISERDKIDSSRKASPLVIAEDAVEIDSSDLSAADVVEKVLESIRSKR